MKTGNWLVVNDDVRQRVQTGRVSIVWNWQAWSENYIDGGAYEIEE